MSEKDKSQLSCILNVDIVGSTKLDQNQQVACFNQLQQTLLSLDSFGDIPPQQRIYITTGDGFILILYNGAGPYMALVIAVEFQTKLRSHMLNLEIHTGIHCGVIEKVLRQDGSEDAIGSAIGETVELAKLSGGSQILMSEDYFKQVARTREEYRNNCNDCGLHTMKNKQKLKIYNYFDGSKGVGLDSPPQQGHKRVHGAKDKWPIKPISPRRYGADRAWFCRKMARNIDIQLAESLKVERPEIDEVIRTSYEEAKEEYLSIFQHANVPMDAHDARDQFQILTSLNLNLFGRFNGEFVISVFKVGQQANVVGEYFRKNALPFYYCYGPFDFVTWEIIDRPDTDPDLNFALNRRWIGRHLREVVVNRFANPQNLCASIYKLKYTILYGGRMLQREPNPELGDEISSINRLNKDYMCDEIDDRMRRKLCELNYLYGVHIREKTDMTKRIRAYIGIEVLPHFRSYDPETVECDIIGINKDLDLDYPISSLFAVESYSDPFDYLADVTCTTITKLDLLTERIKAMGTRHGWRLDTTTFIAAQANFEPLQLSTSAFHKRY